MSLAIVSFDAVSSENTAFLSTLPNFSRLMQNGTLVTDVNSVFISNTYPAHCSVITGNHPGRHGVPENIFPSADEDNQLWRCSRSNIKTTTLYDEARKAGIKTSAILWPVTGGANMAKNLPEMHILEGQNQIVESLKAGSKWFQIKSLLKYRKYLNGVSQPELDTFVTKCAVGARGGIDLLLVHLTDVDSHKHVYGPDSDEARAAIVRLDGYLGEIMAAYPGWDFIVFGDHGCKRIVGSIDLKQYWDDAESFWHPAGGCAFLKTSGADDETQRIKAAALMKNPDCHIKRILSAEEMAVSGLGAEFLLGVEGEDGYCFAPHEYKGNHGYSLAGEGYKVFYLASGVNIYKGKRTQGGCITDIAPLGAKMLGLPLWEMDGKINTEVYDG